MLRSSIVSAGNFFFRFRRLLFPGFVAAVVPHCVEVLREGLSADPGL